MTSTAFDDVDGDDVGDDDMSLPLLAHQNVVRDPLKEQK